MVSPVTAAADTVSNSVWVCGGGTVVQVPLGRPVAAKQPAGAGP